MFALNITYRNINVHLNSITLHRLGQFEKAQTHLEQSKELNPKEKTLVTWLRKNEDKLPKKVAEPVKEAPVAATPTPPPKAAGR